MPTCRTLDMMNIFSKIFNHFYTINHTLDEKSPYNRIFIFPKNILLFNDFNLYHIRTTKVNLYTYSKNYKIFI